MSEGRDKVFRVLTTGEWERAQREGRIARSELDERDGFVHLSTASTSLETADRYFEASSRPVLIEMDAKELGEALRWETVVTRNNQVFPHLYANGIPLEAVCAVIPLESSGDAFHRGPRQLMSFKSR